MGKDSLVNVAKNTLEIFDNGFYNYNITNEQYCVSVENLNHASYKKAMLIKEDDDRMKYDMNHRKFEKPASILVLNEPVTDTFIGCDNKYGVLNFASAYHPGGGFLKGSMAQEESLCYTSNLYYLQLKFEDDFYKYNKQFKTKCYTDRMIYTPNTVFIKDSTFHLLSKLKLVDVLTSPAVNLGAALNNAENYAFCIVTMKNRMRKILSVFANEGNDRIILGAYGCGIFKNEPEVIARYWKELLDEGFKYQFKEVIFAVYDASISKGTFQDFKNVLE